MAEDAPTYKPPYVPWKTFENVTDELRGKGLPGTLDRSAIQGKSGSVQAMYLAALRYLGMLDGQDRPTERFKAYVAQPDQRKKILGDVLQERYGEALGLGTSSTSAQLTQQFRDYGLEGETARKAIAFFLNAANFAGIKVSPYWPQTRPGGGGRRRSTGTSAKPRKRATRGKNPEPEGSGENGAQTGTSEDPKSRYINLLLDKAQEDFDTDLLDRIERVIGIDHGPKRQKTRPAAKPDPPIPPPADDPEADDG